VWVGQLSVAASCRPRTTHQPDRRTLLGHGRRPPPHGLARRTGRLPPSGGGPRGRRRLPRSDRLPRPVDGRRVSHPPVPQLSAVPGKNHAARSQQTDLLVGDELTSTHVLRGSQRSRHTPLRRYVIYVNSPESSGSH